MKPSIKKITICSFMKKTILLFILGFVLISGSVKSQIPNFCVGPKIGYSTVMPEFTKEAVKTGVSSSFNFGAFARIGEKWFIQPEANFITKGGLFDYTSNGSIQSQEIKLKTITMPLLIGRRFMNLKFMSLHAMAGPVGSLVTDKSFTQVMGSDFPIQSAMDLKDLMWSLQVGGGIDLLFLTFDVRYEIGLSNAYKGSNTTFSFKDNMFNVSLGLKLL
jgi:hypothetical protein